MGNLFPMKVDPIRSTIRGVMGVILRWIMTSDQSRRAWQASMFFATILLAFPDLEARAPTAWEEKESKAILEVARRFEGQGRLEEAVKEYSEILEFFPDTKPWREACIRLSDLYLKTRREEQSRLVLARLKRRADQKTEDLVEDVLIAHVQNFINREAYKEMGLWLKERSEKERERLRGSEDLIALWAQLQQRSDLGPEEILNLWSQFGHQRPIKGLVEMARKEDIPLSKEFLLLLHREVIKLEDVDTLSSVTSRMIQSGWGKSAHAQFKESGDKANALKSLWLQSMISGRLFEEALEVLDTMEDSKDRIVERMGVLIGLKRFEQGFHLLRANSSWLENALTMEQFGALLEGVLALPQGPLYGEQFLEALKEGGKRDLLQARWMLQGKEKELKLRKIAENDDFYGSQAAGDLGEILSEEGRLTELREWEVLISKRFPDSPELKELRKRVETLSDLRGEGEGVSSP